MVAKYIKPVALCSISLVVLAAIFICRSNLDNLSSDQVDVSSAADLLSPTPLIIATIEPTIKTDTEIYKSYVYDFDGIIQPKILVEYPTYGWTNTEEFIRGGTYDFVFTKADFEIKMDMTGLNSNQIDEAALESLTSFGSTSKDLFKLTITSSGKNKNGVAYKIFQINKDAHYIAVLEIPETNSSSSSWYVFITIKDDSLMKTLNYMIHAVKALD